jgi:hypothetical protein
MRPPLSPPLPGSLARMLPAAPGSWGREFSKGAHFRGAPTTGCRAQRAEQFFCVASVLVSSGVCCRPGRPVDGRHHAIVIPSRPRLRRDWSLALLSAQRSPTPPHRRLPRDKRLSALSGCRHRCRCDVGESEVRFTPNTTDSSSLSALVPRRRQQLPSGP